MNRRLTLAQAIVAFLSNQYSSRDNRERRFFEGCFGIFVHGNVAGMGQALEQDRRLRYFLCRNEQAMVHTAGAFSTASFRLHNVDRTRRDKHGHWGSFGNHQPSASAAFAWGYFREKKCVAGFAATGISRITRRFRE